MKVINQDLAIVEEGGDDTKYTLRRDKTGRVWVQTWHVSRHGHGGPGASIQPKDFGSVTLNGKRLDQLVEEALLKIDGRFADPAFKTERRS